MSFTKFALCLAVVLFSAPSFAAGSIEFTNPVAQPSISPVGVALFTVTAKSDDVITGASSDRCDAVEIHTSEMKGDIMRMRKVGKLPLKAGVPVQVLGAEGGMHTMLIGLKKPLNAGETVNITFTFEKSPPQTIVFHVMSNGSSAATPAAESHSHH